MEETKQYVRTGVCFHTAERKNKRSVGTAYEALAAQYLTGQRYEIIERNFRCRQGEIDLVARDGEYLCFVEVKYRKGADQGSAAEAVHRKKQQKIIRVAQYYMMTHGLSEWTLSRFDVIAIDGDKITLYKNAFQL